MVLPQNLLTISLTVKVSHQNLPLYYISFYENMEFDLMPMGDVINGEEMTFLETRNKNSTGIIWQDVNLMQARFETRIPQASLEA